MTDPLVRAILKIVIASIAVALVLLYAYFDAKQIRRGRRILAVVLILLGLASAAAYLEFGVKRYGIYMNPHDFYHYYTGSKYAEEIGYHNQYKASLIADMEGAKWFDTSKRIRNLRNHGYLNSKAVIREGDDIKALFSPARWEDFSKDIAYFQSLVYKAKWNRMLRDKGFNGTPVWVMTAGFLTNRIPTSDEFGMRFLVVLDLLLIVLMLAFVWAAFGPRVMFFATVFFGTNFMMSFVHIKGALLRLDWVALLVISLCLMKMKRYKLAGGCMAYSAMARIFPAIFLFGFGAQAVWGLIQKRTIERKYIEFFVTFVLVSAVLVGATLVVGGTGQWDEFFDKIRQHNKDISTTRVGFKYIFLYPFESFGQKVEGFKDHQVAWWTIQAFVLAFLFFAVRKLEDYETIAFGFVPAFFLTAPTFYYYVMLIVPLLLFLPKTPRTGRVVGVCLMFLLSISAYCLNFAYNLNFFLCFLLSCGLLGLCAYICGLALLAAPAKTAPETEARAALIRRGRLPIAATALLFLIVLGVALRPQASTSAAAPGDRAQGEAVLALVGDVMLSRNVAKSIQANNRSFGYLFANTAPYTREADIAFCNLESPLSGQGEKLEKKYTFNAPGEAVSGLTSGGFDVVSLANNHILDYGTVALDDTLRSLSGAAIIPVGLSEKEGPQKPAIFERNGVRIGFLAYADRRGDYSYPRTFLPFDTRPAEAREKAIARDIGQLRRKVDIIVVSLHWGVEYNEKPSERQKTLARFIIEYGADIVAGHHPHVQQEPQWHKGGLILYSMGNFVFDQHTRPLTRASRLYRVHVTKEGVTAAEYLPLEIRKGDWQAQLTGQGFRPIPNPASKKAEAAGPVKVR